jgi:hypothetical protein
MTDDAGVSGFNDLPQHCAGEVTPAGDTESIALRYRQMMARTDIAATNPIHQRLLRRKIAPTAMDGQGPIGMMPRPSAKDRSNAETFCSFSFARRDNACRDMRSRAVRRRKDSHGQLIQIPAAGHDGLQAGRF